MDDSRVMSTQQDMMGDGKQSMAGGAFLGRTTSMMGGGASGLHLQYGN